MRRAWPAGKRKRVALGKNSFFPSRAKGSGIEIVRIEPKRRTTGPSGSAPRPLYRLRECCRNAWVRTRRLGFLGLLVFIGSAALRRGWNQDRRETVGMNARKSGGESQLRTLRTLPTRRRGVQSGFPDPGLRRRIREPAVQGVCSAGFSLWLGGARAAVGREQPEGRTTNGRGSVGGVPGAFLSLSTGTTPPPRLPHVQRTRGAVP